MTTWSGPGSPSLGGSGWGKGVGVPEAEHPVDVPLMLTETTESHERFRVKRIRWKIIIVSGEPLVGNAED